MNPLIVSKKVLGKETTIIIKRTNPKRNSITKLSNVFKKIPSGLILKGETGLGATTLEINSSRNSIIVEPIKITASSKAFQYSKSNKNKNAKALYVGSTTTYHPKKLKDGDILKYINDKKIKYKKIVVVADSLYRIERTLNKSLYTQFFFMIDEIDSFQLDSSFRLSMENCIDIYKQFPKNKRAMASATSLDFTDPILADEKITKINYDKPTTRTIDLYFEPYKIKNSAAKIIENTILKNKPDEKLMIAYNSVTGCFDIAKALIKRKIIEEKDVKILCSNNSKEKIKGFYSELTTTELPSKITFVTSAYFTGFDLTERYHLISISSTFNKIYSLSDKRFLQIAGRCRNEKGLLSETIIYDIITEKTKEGKYTKIDILEAAAKEIVALNCIENNYKHHSLLKDSIYKIKNLIVQNTSSYGHQYVRMNKDEPVISYFNIDAFLETLRIRKELYLLKDSLPATLRKGGHTIKIKRLKGDIEVDCNSIDKQSRQEQVSEIIDILRSYPNDYLSLILSKKLYSFSAFQKNILLKYLDLSSFIENEKLIALIETAGNTRDGRKLNNLFASAYFFSMDPSVHYKRIVYYHFPIGKSFTGFQLLEKWNRVFMEEGLSTRRLNSSTQAIRLIKLYFKTNKLRSKETRHKIINDNPFKLSLINYRTYEQNFEEKLITMSNEEVPAFLDAQTHLV